MITIAYKNDDEVIETVRWMRDVWKEEWVVKPTSIEVLVSKDLTDTEKDYLDKVMSWVYPMGVGVITINGEEHDVSKYSKPVFPVDWDDFIEKFKYDAPERRLEVTGDITVTPQVTWQCQQLYRV